MTLLLVTGDCDGQIRASTPRLQFRCTNRIGLRSTPVLPCFCRFFASLVFEPCGSDNGGPNTAAGNPNTKSGGFGANDACGVVGTWWPKPDS